MPDFQPETFISQRIETHLKTFLETEETADDLSTYQVELIGEMNNLSRIIYRFSLSLINCKAWRTH